MHGFNSVINFNPHREKIVIKAFDKEFVHRSFVEELLFWTIVYKFPDHLVFFLVSMLPDLEYKIAFADSFVNHYTRISMMLATYRDGKDNLNSNDSPARELLSNCVVHVSVQLLSHESLVIRLCEKRQLFYFIIGCFRATFEGTEGQENEYSGILINSCMQDATKNKHMVINCDHYIVKKHAYWSLVSDLNNVLIHYPVAIMFLESSDFLDFWLQFMLNFQGMNLNIRELEKHVEYENDAYYAAFSTEHEVCATPLWTLISHLKCKKTAHLTEKIILHSQKFIEEWFSLINFTVTDIPDPHQATFHLPLHRYYSIFLHNGAQYQGLCISDFLPSSEEKLKLYLAFPLQVMVCFYEILSGLWVRNGLQMKGQAMTYIQCHFCNSMIDPDLFLIQQISAVLNPDWFIQTVLERFHVWDWLSLDTNSNVSYNNGFMDTDHIMPMLEGALTFLASLFSIQTNLGINEDLRLREEMIALLAMTDRTHSQLLGLLPEKCATSLNNRFEDMLQELAEYRKPSLESQGLFSPKNDVWENEYDPLKVLLRAVYRKDYQSSLDRFIQFAKQNGKLANNTQPWPPFRIPSDPNTSKFLDPRKILYSKVLHGTLFTILYKAIYVCDISDQALALTIFILETALRYPVPDDTSPVLKLDGPTYSPTYVSDLNFGEWFDSHSLLQNMNHVIRNVTVIERQNSRGSNEDGPSVEEMEIDLISFNEEDSDENLDEVYMTAEAEKSLAINRDVRLALDGPPTTYNSNTSTALVPLPNMDIVPQISVSPSTSTSSNDQVFSSSTPYKIPLSSTSSESTDVQASSTAIIPRLYPRVPASRRMYYIKRRNMGSSYRYTQIVNSTESNLSLSSFEDEISGVTEMIRALPSYSGEANISIAPVNESILSLLLQLHSKLTLKPDSYEPSASPSSSRIGDGAHFVKIILDVYCNLNVSSGITSIQELRKKIWKRPESSCPINIDQPSCSLNTNSVNSSETLSRSLDKEEKRRKAKERQQKLIAEYASKQKAFLKKMNESTTENKSPEAEDYSDQSLSSSSLLQAPTYVCVICSQTYPSTLKRLMGMIVLLQPTSVLGHSVVTYVNEKVEDKFSLPCAHKESSNFKKKLTMSSYMEDRVDQFSHNFDSSSWLFALNNGWEGGIHIQSCGHYIHLDCHKNYIQSLRDAALQNRNRNTPIPSDFSCPLCRQMANSVLPLNPDLGQVGAMVKCRPPDSNSIGHEMMTLMNTIITPDTNLLTQFITFCDDLTKTARPQHRSPRTSPSAESLFAFMCSIIRSNLECELLVRLTNSKPTGAKKSCFGKLLFNIVFD